MAIDPIAVPLAPQLPTVPLLRTENRPSISDHRPQEIARRVMPRAAAWMIALGTLDSEGVDLSPGVKSLMPDNEGDA